MALTSRYRARVEALRAEALREVGILLVAFSPLDAAFAAPGTQPLVFGLIFLAIGLLLFNIGLRMERRHGER